MAPGNYHRHGVRFRFPRSWKLTEEESQNQTCITVSGPRTAFWSLTLFFDCPSPDDVNDTVLEAFRDEYEDLDVYPAVVQIGSLQAVGADIEFVALDLTNSAFVRVCRTDDFTAVVLYQSTDDELADGLPLLEGITDSVEFESEAAWPDFEARELESDEENNGNDAARPHAAGGHPSHEGDHTNGESGDDDVDEDERWIPVE